jgi:hypothetical protein
MTEAELEQLRYPTGKFEKPGAFDREMLGYHIQSIENFPALVIAELQDLNKDTLVYRYRPGSWNIRQLIHHCADSHMNAFIRFKWTLTEKSPVIKPYLEDKWAELPDTTEADVTISALLLSALHARWAILLRALTAEQLQRKYIHPEYGKEYKLWEVAALYSWHCRHHLEHIRQAKKLKFP